MILITGATGFVGQRLVRRLVADAGLQARVLLRPGTDLDRLPRSVPVDAAVADLFDREALRDAMDGVHTIIHLMGTDTRGRHAELKNVDIEGTRRLLSIAREKRVGRILYLSRIGADRGSAFTVLRTKGEVEDLIKRSGLAYTIFRSSILFGRGDRFSEHVAMLSRSFPAFFVPSGGDMTLQPLWVEDLVTCMLLSLERIEHVDRVISLGGPEMLSYRRIVLRTMYATGRQKPIISLPMLIHKWAAWYLDGLFYRWPFTELWVELLSATQTVELGIIERDFEFRPVTYDLGILRTYMSDRRYLLSLVKYVFTQEW